MPVTIKQGRMKYKNSQGQYQTIDVVGQGDIVSTVEDWMDDNISGISGTLAVVSQLPDGSYKLALDSSQSQS